jgi:hypothetical protein
MFPVRNYSVIWINCVFTLNMAKAIILSSMTATKVYTPYSRLSLYIDKVNQGYKEWYDS